MGAAASWMMRSSASEGSAWPHHSALWNGDFFHTSAAPPLPQALWYRGFHTMLPRRCPAASPPLPRRCPVACYLKNGDRG